MITKIKAKISGLLFSFTLLFASQAHAGLIDVSTIEISNAIGQHNQVAEVIALDMFGDDVALLSAGATASALSQWNNITSPDNAIDGVTSGNYRRGEIYHNASGTQGTSNAVLFIRLPSPTELLSFEIFGRTDCCSDRDVFNVRFLDSNNQELYSARLDARFSSAQVVLPNTKVSEPAIFMLFALGLAAMGFRVKG